MTSSIAFCWADEPSAFSVPLKQLSSAAAALVVLSPSEPVVVLSSLPQAVSRSAPAASATAVREKRLSFTGVSSKDVCVCPVVVVATGSSSLDDADARQRR